MPKMSSSFYRILIFVVGVIATIAYRLVVVLNHYSQFWVEVIWYIGTVGFIWYFGHRYRVEVKRDRIIEKLHLIEKTERGEYSAEDKEAVLYILKGLDSSLAKWNYIAIFVLSFMAMGYAIYMDLTTILK
jgi:hypothetical protein